MFVKPQGSIEKAVAPYCNYNGDLVSKFAKLLARLVSIPKDFTWDELVTALGGLGFRDISDKPGSYRTFVRASGLKIFLHKPHPDNVVKTYVLKQVVRVLRENGLLK